MPKRNNQGSKSRKKEQKPIKKLKRIIKPQNDPKCIKRPIKSKIKDIMQKRAKTHKIDQKRIKRHIKP